jgi:CheY-like chemotaxis protein
MSNVARKREFLAGIQVLFVDDNFDAREIIKGFLEYYGAIARVAWSPQEAIEAFQRITPHIVIPDLSMPGHDGSWLLKKIREMPRGFAVPVIALTAHSGQYARDVMLRDGFDGYLTKPISAEKLYAAVARFVGR